MFDKLSKKLAPYARAHAWSRWPILGLLMLVWCLDFAWRSTRDHAGCVGRRYPGGEG